MNKPDFSNSSAIYINCTLKKSPATSHTSTLMNVSQKIMKNEKVKVEEIRLVDHEVVLGMKPDMTEHGWDKDEWPTIFDKIIKADILCEGFCLWRLYKTVNHIHNSLTPLHPPRLISIRIS